MDRKIKILIVDDEIKFLDAISKRIEMRGFEVRKATNGKTAIEIARNEKFDLALLDMKMPGMDGKEVLKILKKEDNYIEVIILTGHGSLDNAVESTKLGAFGYLPKPYEFDGLIQKLKDAYFQRIQNKFEKDTKRMEKIMKIATGESPLGILKKLRELDDDIK